MIQQTLSIVKPDGVKKRAIGAILSRFEKARLEIIALKLTKLSKKDAEGFYAVHKERPFFGSLIEFMTSGPVVISVLRGENAVLKNRELMGATNPANADVGTIRKDFATDVEKNAVHGSDSPENAAIEIRYFFSDVEIHRSNP